MRHKRRRPVWGEESLLAAIERREHSRKFVRRVAVILAVGALVGGGVWWELKRQENSRLGVVERFLRDFEPTDVFPFELAEVKGSEASGVLRAMRLRGQGSGYTPVLLGGAENVAVLAERLSEDRFEPKLILEKAAAIDVSSWFDARAVSKGAFSADEGEWPIVPTRNDRFSAHIDALTKKPKNTVFIAKIPTSKSWEVAAYLNLGGWNECPSAEYQVAILRYWHLKHGADIVAVTEDSIEFLVEEPPGYREEAKRLAKEHFLYCPDVVHQGSETLSNLAATLISSEIWIFWWD